MIICGVSWNPFLSTVYFKTRYLRIAWLTVFSHQTTHPHLLLKLMYSMSFSNKYCRSITTIKRSPSTTTKSFIPYFMESIFCCFPVKQVNQQNESACIYSEWLTNASFLELSLIFPMKLLSLRFLSSTSPSQCLRFVRRAFLLSISLLCRISWCFSNVFRFPPLPSLWKR